MKKFIILFFTAVSVTLQAIATDWVKLSENCYIDMDTIKYDENNAKVWIKFDGSNIQSYSNTPKVHWIYRLESFVKDSNSHLTLNEIIYDEDMQIIENILNPYGSFPQKFNSNSCLDMVKGRIFK